MHNNTIPDDGVSRVRTISQGKERLRALRFAKTHEGKRKAAEDAANPPREILKKLRQITYGTGFNWEERFAQAPPYTDTSEEQGGLALSPQAASQATTAESFVEIIHQCNALCQEKLPNSKQLEINAMEYEVLLRRYSDYKGRIRWRRFVNDLAIGPPQDYMDPDLQFDTLPQPYGLLVETIDDVYDQAWELIEKKNGLTSVGATLTSGGASSDSTGVGGGSASGAASVASRNFFYPTSISKRITSGIGAPMFMNACPIRDESRILIATEEGELVVFDAAKDELVAMTTPFPDSAGGITCMSAPQVSDHCKWDALCGCGCGLGLNGEKNDERLMECVVNGRCFVVLFLCFFVVSLLRCVLFFFVVVLFHRYTASVRERTGRRRGGGVQRNQRRIEPSFVGSGRKSQTCGSGGGRGRGGRGHGQKGQEGQEERRGQEGQKEERRRGRRARGGGRVRSWQCRPGVRSVAP